MSKYYNDIFEKQEQEKKDKIEALLKRLDKELQSTDYEEKQEAQMLRLRNAAKVYQGEDRVISSHELAKEIKEAPEEHKILTGITGIDNILKGFRLKQLITLSAPTKSGKTSFCIDLTTKIRDENPLWFPFEEGAEELIQKFIDRDEEPPLFYTPRRSTVNSLEWVEQKIVESIVKYDTRIVFIDHLDFIVPFLAGKERHDLVVGNTMRELKKMATRWNIAIILIAHMKKTRIDTQPSLEDIRGSASIAQESDTVMLLWREQKRSMGEVVITDNVNLSIQANRRTGRTGNIKLVFKDGKFLEEEWRSDYYEAEHAYASM